MNWPEIMKVTTIKRKLFLSYLAILFLMVTVIALLTGTVLQRILQREMMELKRESVTQMQDKLQLITDHILAVSNIYYINSNLSRILPREIPQGSYEWYAEQALYDELFYQYDFAFDWLDYHTSIIGFNGKAFHSFSPLKGSDLLPRLREEPWYDALLTNGGRVIWQSEILPLAELSGGGAGTLYAVRQLHSMFTGNPIGILIIGVDIDSFDNRLYQGSVERGEKVYLINDEEELVSASDYGGLESGLLPSLTSAMGEAPAGTLRLPHNGTVYQAVWDTTAMNGWRLISLERDRSLFGIIYLSRRFLLIILVLCLIVASVFSLSMAALFSRPIHTLSEEMQRVEAGDLNVRSSVCTSDEIGNLAHRFNMMLEKTQELLKNIMYITDLKQKAELEALQSQINPHFIYNSLGTIRFMLRLEPKEAVDKAMVSLTKMLRYTLSGHSSLVMLSQELEMTRHYLAIAERQLHAPLELRDHTAAETEHCYIPKLIIQPLVENAVFHGIKAAKSPGVIQVSSRQEGEDLLLDIKDNGIGFPLASIEELRNRSAPRGVDSGGNGIGILNIHDRLSLRFGPGYGLNLIEREGCHIQIRLPLLTSDQSGGEHSDESVPG